MYGDTDVMRRRALQLRDQAVDIRATADGLVAQTEAIAWTGRAAEAMRERVRDRAVRLRDVAARHEAAADALDRHLREVDTLKDTIAATERRAAALLDDAQHSTHDPALAAFTPPPAGHRDWLTVELPGA